MMNQRLLLPQFGTVSLTQLSASTTKNISLKTQDSVNFSGRHNDCGTPASRSNRLGAKLLAALLSVGLIASACASDAERAVDELIGVCEGDDQCEIDQLNLIIDSPPDANTRIEAINQYMDRNDVDTIDKVKLLVEFLSGEAFSDSDSLDEVAKIEDEVVETASRLRDSLDETNDAELIDLLNGLILFAPRDDKRYDTYDVWYPEEKDRYGRFNQFEDTIDAHEETHTDTYIERRYPRGLERVLSNLRRWVSDRILLADVGLTEPIPSSDSSGG